MGSPGHLSSAIFGSIIPGSPDATVSGPLGFAREPGSSVEEAWKPLLGTARWCPSTPVNFESLTAEATGTCPGLETHAPLDILTAACLVVGHRAFLLATARLIEDMGDADDDR